MGEKVTVLISNRETGSNTWHTDIPRDEVEAVVDRNLEETAQYLAESGTPLVANEPGSGSRVFDGESTQPDTSIAYSIIDGTPAEALRGQGIERTGRISSDTLAQRVSHVDLPQEM